MSAQAQGRKTRNSTTSTSKKDTYANDVAIPCKQCEKMVIDVGVLCSFCDNWYCQPCTDLTPAVLKSLDNSPDCLMWFCKACTTVLPGLKKLLVRVTTCENEQTELKQRVTQLEQKEVAMNIKSNDFENRLASLEGQSQSNDHPPQVGANLTEVVDNVLSERADQEKRKLNLICINLKESDKDTPSDRRDEDSENLQYLLIDQLGVDSNIETFDLVRLGKKDGNNQAKVRPLRFKVRDLESKNIILRAGKYLRNSTDESVRNIFITPDLTKQQRDEAYKLRREKKQREEDGEENLRIVRGKIVKDQPTSRPTKPTGVRTTRYKWYGPPRHLAKQQNNDICAEHPSFFEDGFDAGGTSAGVD